MGTYLYKSHIPCKVAFLLVISEYITSIQLYLFVLAQKIGLTLKFSYNNYLSDLTTIERSEDIDSVELQSVHRTSIDILQTNNKL